MSGWFHELKNMRSSHFGWRSIMASSTGLQAAEPMKHSTTEVYGKWSPIGLSLFK